LSSRVAVIVAGAGVGVRFGGPVKKTFANIDGRAVMLRTLELFANRDDVCQILLAVSVDDYDTIKAKFGANLGFMGVTLVKGGEKRWQTVRNAINEVRDDAELIAVHDAVRPCLTEEKITEVFEAANISGGAILAAPIDSTIKRVGKDDTIEATTDRRRLYLAQTPQVFKRQVLIDAYATMADEGGELTDDAQVVERAGGKVTIVRCDQSNIKITRPGDLRLASAILETLPKPKRPGPTGPWAGEKGW